MTEAQLLELLRVQSNLGPSDFESLFGIERGRDLFHLFSRNNWNLLHFLFNNINGEDRDKLIEYINEHQDNG